MTDIDGSVTRRLYCFIVACFVCVVLGSLVATLGLLMRLLSGSSVVLYAAFVATMPAVLFTLLGILVAICSSRCGAAGRGRSPGAVLGALRRRLDHDVTQLFRRP